MTGAPVPPRKIIVAGSRSITDYALVEHVVALSGWAFSELVSGCAPGVDELGERYARERGIPLRQFAAPWGAHGLRAGRLRNSQMATHADALIAVWDGRSPGTCHMVECMRALGKPVFLYQL